MTASIASSGSSVVPAATQVFRVEVYLCDGQDDPIAASTLAQIRASLPQVQQVRTARVFLIQGPLAEDQVTRIAEELLADPVTQHAVVGTEPVATEACCVEIHYQSGVMDPVAQSTREAIAEMLSGLNVDQIEVRTGWRYDLVMPDADAARAAAPAALAFAQRALANPVIQDIHTQPFHPSRFPATHQYQFQLTRVPLRDLDDTALMQMSRQAHLFLSLQEMQAIRDYYRQAGREPTDIELESIAQTWSEHCVHKTLKATIHYSQPPATAAASGANPGAADWANRPGHELNADGSLTIHNLLKTTIAAATFKLMEEEAFGGVRGRGWCISVFKDNAGVVRFDDQDAVCIKVETHNHPSAIEPYGGAATGIGGCIRDVMGTGLAARPIANTDVFAVAPPDFSDDGAALPKGVIGPRRILEQVVAGVRDYGNRMGIPTVSGGVYFHPDYLANPLVFAGCVGLLPLDRCFGQAQPGDHIIVLGGRTGRDGIHGATFSSAELTDTHADEFAHAVQIGNAITQKKVLDVILQAREHKPSGGACLFSGITDCGAGGFSSAVGEMGKELGGTVYLDRAPLKYEGLSYTEIWISEAQERMVLAVPEANVATVIELAQNEDVEVCDLGTFGAADASGAGDRQLTLMYHGAEVGKLSMHFLHDGVPMPTRQATWPAPPASRPSPGVQGGIPHGTTTAGNPGDAGDLLLKLLSHPNIASKHWIIRQYDHEVQGGSAVKPLVGPYQDGPSDAAVLRPKPESQRAIAISSGLQTGLGEKTTGGDSYWMTLAAIDEAVRNVVCAGAEPDPAHSGGGGGIAILDNFCWPRCEDPAQLGSLVRAAEACYDGALAYRTPFVSGKDSLSNQFTTENGKLITIPPTLLITALGIVPDARRCRTMDAKAPGNLLLIAGRTGSELGGSHYQMVTADSSRNMLIPHVDLKLGPQTARAVAKAIEQGLIESAHDCSDGGLLVAAAEMAFAGRVGLDLNLDQLPADRELDDLTACFAETPSRYLLEIRPENLSVIAQLFKQVGVPLGQVGLFARHDRLTVRCGRHGRIVDQPLDALRQTWLQPLDW